MTCDLTALTAQYEAAKLAYHNLMTGKMPRVIVDQNGERVEFTATNRTGLLNYIKELEQKLGYPGCSAGSQPQPLRFVF